MMPNPADLVDVAARFWRPLTSHEETVTYTLLDDAWALLTFKRRNLETDLAAGTVATANVVRVLAAMVIRVLNNPEGKAQEAIDDYSYRRDATGASGALMVTAEELDDLTPAGAVTHRRSVRLVVYGDR